jgi:D-alanine--poly(phosphoribitol) ligase subunit 2
MPPTEANRAVATRTLEILCEVVGDDEVGHDLDTPLFASGLLDSLGVVRLMVGFEEAFALVISPAELDRETWSTPRSLIADIEGRLGRARAA